MSRPEKAVDARLNGLLTSVYKKQEKDNHIIINMNNQLPFSDLCIINFHKEDLPFRYSSVDSYARKIIELSSDEGYTKVATTIHGPTAGLDASQAMETMLFAFASELKTRGQLGDLQEILFIEREKEVFDRLQERMHYLSKEKGLIAFKGKKMFLKPATAKNFVSAEQARTGQLSEKPIYIAMPYDRKFAKVYLHGIKEPIEALKHVPDLTAQDTFVGDIVSRIKVRIRVAQLIIADITGDNPNVFYEVGYAEGLKKKIILISQNQKIPFDLRNQRCIYYSPRKINALEDKLKESLIKLIKSSANTDSGA